ncbi:Aste57867_10359 [Aphanomyces stellatus]|uniref:Aste57867_10359 protein n=1 Tax=Aphanomyces stellatus TaxID=120398 RepID=A0A485KQM9_9STRA|nr:hypothetical protein As57867_010319 [Aphanomyces stellatus]VFT87233.1 Aste57867_10359 [Aphanomyces stellatus]
MWPPMVPAWKTMPPLTRQPLFMANSKKRHVRFGTVTTFVFPLTCGGSAVPRDQGPPIGLAATHARQECQHISGMSHRSDRVRRRVGKFDRVERTALLLKAGYSLDEVTEMTTDVVVGHRSRDDSSLDNEVIATSAKRRRVEVLI